MAKIKLNMDSLKTRRDIVRHKIVDGDNIYRILPPFGTDNNGFPYKYWKIIWGLKDPTTGRDRPYVSSSMNYDYCPIQEYTKKLSKDVDALKLELSELKEEKNPKNEDKIEALKERIDIGNGLLRLKPKGVYLYNAINKSGQVGILEIKKTAHDKLKELIKGYVKKENMDPTSLNSNLDEQDSGVWFCFSRTGKGFETKYDVKINQIEEKVNNRKVYVDDITPIPDNVIENYDTLAYDIHTMYTHICPEDLTNIFLAHMRTINVPKEFRYDLDLGDDDDVEVPEQDEPVQEPAVEQKKEQPVVAPKKTINLKFDDEEDDADEIPASEPPKAKVAKPVVQDEDDDDDVFAMANNILRKK